MKKYICDKCNKEIKENGHHTVTIKYPADSIPVFTHENIILDLCEKCTNELLIKAWYRCDRKACDLCNSECDWTDDIKHAVNFVSGGKCNGISGYFEVEKQPSNGNVVLVNG